MISLSALVASISSSIPNVRRASGVARMVARSLLAQLGYSEARVPKGAGGAPVWTVGVVGSLAYDDEIAVAAVGLRRDFASVGIDVERADALPSDMLTLVATQSERRRIEDDLVKAKRLFAVKGAVCKAVYPLDGVFLEFGDSKSILPPARRRRDPDAPSHFGRAFHRISWRLRSFCSATACRR